MAEYQPKDGQGSLFRNEKTKDSQPDYTGTLMIDGTLYRVAGWIKEGNKGKFMSLKAEPKEDRGGGQGDRAPAKAAASGIDPESIPF